MSTRICCACRCAGPFPETRKRNGRRDYCCRCLIFDVARYVALGFIVTYGPHDELWLAVDYGRKARASA